MLKMKCAVAIGSPFDGLYLWGPFDDQDAARMWAEKEITADENWWLVELENPGE